MKTLFLLQNRLDCKKILLEFNPFKSFQSLITRISSMNSSSPLLDDKLIEESRISYSQLSSLFFSLNFLF